MKGKERRVGGGGGGGRVLAVALEGERKRPGDAVLRRRRLEAYGKRKGGEKGTILDALAVKKG